MKLLRSLSLLFSILIFAAKADAASFESVVYDFSKDYSLEKNPNGVWSYGYSTTVAGEFSLMRSTNRSDNGSSVLEWWQHGEYPHPFFVRNSSTNSSYESGGMLIGPGEVATGIGLNGTPPRYCVARFVAPEGTTKEYLLTTSARNRITGGTDFDYHVLHNGISVFTVFSGPNSIVGFSTNVWLQAGDILDFVSGPGADNNEAGGGTNIKIKLEAPSDAPCTPRKARATAQLVNGFLVGATITDTGCGYTNAPLVVIEGGGGFGAAATAVITDGRVTAIQITDAGFGYDQPPRILIASPPFVPHLSIAVSKVQVIQEVTLGRRYVLEASHDSQAWSVVVPAFTAMSESITNEFDTALTGRFFRVRESQ